MRYIAIALMFGSCTLFTKYPDSPPEEFIEDLIEEETGIDVDFSGESKEWS